MYPQRESAVSPTNIEVDQTADSSLNYRTDTIYVPHDLLEQEVLPGLPPVSSPNDRTKKLTGLSYLKKYKRVPPWAKFSSSRLQTSVVSASESTQETPGVVFAYRNKHNKYRKRAAAVIIPSRCCCIAKVLAGIIIGLMLVAAIVVPLVFTLTGATTTSK